jgi:NADH oxidase (H2O-forming)
MTDNQTLKVTEDVVWTGVLDPGLVTFDVVMETRYGTTYNSYFINADKKTIIETTKAKFWDTYVEKIRSLVNPEEIEYIVMNHTEPDHSGNLPRLLELAPNATVVGTGNAIRYLTDQMGCDFRHLIVREGNTLDLGNKTLRFISAPNLHWPDTMYTWLEEDKVLFTCDSFGAHFCRKEMFDDLVGDFDDAFRYYFDVILSPYAKFMQQAIGRIRPLDIAVICTGHGPILRRDWKKYVDMSEELSKEALLMPRPNKVLITYVSAYQNTRMIAEKIAEGIRMTGDIEVDVIDVEKPDLAQLEKKLIDASGIIVGSPTFNQNILMPIYEVFALINPVRDRNKLAAAFGSYGWSGEGAKIMTSAMKNLRLDVMDDGLMVKFTPHHESLERCIAYGQSFGQKLQEKAKQ